MKVISIPPTINTLILVSILLLKAVYYSELGGEGTIYGPLSFLLATVFIFLNFRFNRSLLMVFSLPILFALLSFMVNLGGVGVGTVHRIESMIIGYLLLTLSPAPLNESLMRRLVFIYLMGVLLLSFGCYGDQLMSGNVAGGNKNFNINENGASMFFFGGLLLSLIFMKKWLKWIFVAGFIVLILTTGSRTGFCVTILLLASFAFFDKSNNQAFNWKVFFSTKAYRLILLLTMFLGLLYITFPTVFTVLQGRLTVAGLDLASQSGNTIGRDVIWKTALEESLSSNETILFGLSPSQMADRIGINIGTHNSYIDILIFEGWPFLISLLVSIVCLFYYHEKRGHHQFIIFAVSILIYGAFETVLFNGLNFLWYVFIFLSLYYRSFNPLVLTNYNFYPQVRVVN